jgi:glycogen(starch) synthase
MRILMLGWEFPPFISGGLGTACYGLTRALSQQQVNITFVLPKAVGTEFHTHVRLLAPQSPRAATGGRAAGDVASAYRYDEPAEPTPQQNAGGATQPRSEGFANVEFRAVPALFTNPYASPGRPESVSAAGAATSVTPPPPRPVGLLSPPPPPNAQTGDMGEHGYAGDLIQESRRYADLVLDLARGTEFDIVHAHDWLTFPAGMAVAAHTGRPLVVHVHSTEFDRSGENIDDRVYEIERRGVHAAARVIAVSHLTRRILENRYAVPHDKIRVVYNGIQNGAALAAERNGIRKGDKIVLFLGRITMQKGPEYFIAAAKRVLAKMDGVKFVMAGSGDRARDAIELAAREGIGHKVLFTGFLRGSDVDRVFQMADVYVMPSVSEPFGIAALEAVNNNVPVILSKTSGVSEVLRHALKVDFWDTDEMANKIIAVLRHPPLGQTMREQADIEVRRLTWDDAAARTRLVYEDAIGFTP